MSQPVPAQPPPTVPPGRVHLNSLAAHQHALRAAPRPSTYPGDPSQPQQRHHQERRLLSVRHDPDKGGGMMITA